MIQHTREHRRARDRAVLWLSARVVDGVDRDAACPSARTVTVGTAPDNLLVLTDPTVSRYHLVLETSERGIHVRDLGSRNGTFVAHVRIREGYLPNLTQLQIGQTRLEVETGEVTERSQPAAPEIPGLVGESPAIDEVRRLIQRLSESDVTALIQGETGTGKEVVAQAIHRLSGRSDRPLIIVDCGSVPHTLIASELFGHERGAFTGATHRRIGAFESAHGGTIFLDEIGELPPQIQPALLGVLERRKFRRVGGRDEISVDVRVLAATHRELREHVNEAKFRPDLYYRLAVARVEIPPLRERPEDIEPLVHHFVERFTGIPDPDAFGPAVMESLRRHRWSGNVRELRNVVESGLAFGSPRLETDDADSTTGASRALIPYKDARAAALEEFEKRYLGNLMQATSGNASKAAREAKMDRPYLLSLLRRHDLR